MVQEKVTRQELRELHVGQSRIFMLTDAKKVASARITCVQLKNEEGLEFEFRPDYKAKSCCIKRIN